jgi:tRNA (cytidine/uridine-2'-O-)-methyltransferase
VKAKFSIVLVAPDIPGNCGSIGRTCLALNIPLILIKPYGFDLNEKSVRRAGLDYWKHVELFEYEDWQNFITDKNVKSDQLVLFSKNGKNNHYNAPYSENCYLVFGSETKALPADIVEEYKDRIHHLPQFSEHIRSLNLANCATAAAYECLRQLSFPEIK